MKGRIARTEKIISIKSETEREAMVLEILLSFFLATYEFIGDE